MRPEPNKRTDYKHFHTITTRWMDNDVYGHVNNVAYYSWFDTAVNHFLVTHNLINIDSSPVIGLVVESKCNYLSSVAFPDKIEVGLRVTTLGRSSVRYEIGIFHSGAERTSAQGHFVHVYVNRITRQPSVLPDSMRTLLQTIGQ